MRIQEEAEQLATRGLDQERKTAFTAALPASSRRPLPRTCAHWHAELSSLPTCAHSSLSPSQQQGFLCWLPALTFVKQHMGLSSTSAAPSLSLAQTTPSYLLRVPPWGRVSYSSTQGSLLPVSLGWFCQELTTWILTAQLISGLDSPQPSLFQGRLPEASMISLIHQLSLFLRTISILCTRVPVHSRSLY